MVGLGGTDARADGRTWSVGSSSGAGFCTGSASGEVSDSRTQVRTDDLVVAKVTRF